MNHPINATRPHPTLPADHPLNQLQQHPALAEVIEKGSHFQNPPFQGGWDIPQPGHQPSTPSTPSTLHEGPPWLPLLDDNALEQLATLDTFDKAVEAARAAGGPSAGLAALLARPITVGGYKLKAVAAYHFLFLQLIKSPFVTGEALTAAQMPLHVAKALLAFASVPEAGFVEYESDSEPTYLQFGCNGREGEAVVDEQRLSIDAWTLTNRLSLTDIGRATTWLLAQIGGIASLFPTATGEEAGNFPTPAEQETSPPPAAPPAPAPPAGSLS